MTTSDENTNTATKPVDIDRWVDEYGDYLYKYALMRLRDPAVAQDVVQETFLAGIKGLDGFDGRVDVKYWLRGILRNKVVDHIRKASRETPIDDSEDSSILESLLFKTAGIPTTRPRPWQFDPYRSYEKEEFWKAFEHCMQNLRDPLQRAFALKMLEGLSTEEVCKILDITPNNLWVMLHRARNQLKECLEANWDSEED